MRFAISCILAALATAALAVDPLVVDTPTESRQCETTHITWTGGVAPFRVRRKFDGISQDREQLQEHEFDWIVTNVPAGTVVTIEIDDAEGAVAESAPFTVQPSYLLLVKRGDHGGAALMDWDDLVMNRYCS
ncbi:hypothetical protein C8Q77DRAFT_1073025 [Trametes polyzona]|nr:hypothetical protein C8Q77DRAFT_1073025 [Trametes polyzona]